MRAKDHRKGIPLGVRLDACLLLLGYSEEDIAAGIQWDHEPALGLRTIDENGEIQPPANDPRYIRPLRRPDHDAKTRGTGATTAGTDIGKITKLKRIEKDPPGGEAFRRKLLAVKSGEPQPAPKKRKYQWPTGRKIENRKRSKP